MHAPSTNVTLLERLATGQDSDAWASFVERYGPLIRDYGRRSGLQPSDCDDLLQNVLLSLTKALPRFRYDPARGRLRSYLKTVTLRSLPAKVSQLPPTASLDEVDDPATGDGDAWEQAWRKYHLQRALGCLRREFPEQTFTAFGLYVIEGREAQETADQLGISIDSVYQAKSRLLRRVSELVAQQVREEG